MHGLKHYLHISVEFNGKVKEDLVGLCPCHLCAQEGLLAGALSWTG